MLSCIELRWAVSCFVLFDFVIDLRDVLLYLLELC